MRAWNRRKRPKHWTKPKWIYRNCYANEEAFILFNKKLKQKSNDFGCEFRILIISIKIIGA